MKKLLYGIIIVIILSLLLLLLRNFTSREIGSSIITKTENLSSNVENEPEQFNKELEKLITNYLTNNNISMDNIGIYITNYEENEYYELNSELNYIAASVYKLPLAMIYYEMINDNAIELDTLLTFSEYHYEYGGPIAENYNFGDQISVEILLHNMILHSDNSAGHILFENLGGWEAFKILATDYSDTQQDEVFFSENVLNANYINDVLLYLYNNQSKFETLIEDLGEAEPDNYLNLNNHKLAIQKYGTYGNALNSAGIVFENSPYSICIFTNIGIDNEYILSDINKIVFDYYKNKIT